MISCYTLILLASLYQPYMPSNWVNLCMGSEPVVMVA
jgi:hypothetical protein